MTEPEKEEVIRLNVELPKSLNDRWKKRIPWGLKADLIRKLMLMFADYVDKNGLEVVVDLHEDKLEFCRTPVDPTRVNSGEQDAS